MTDTLTVALYSIPSEDRETWVAVGMAIHNEMGDGGFGVWDTWSRQAQSYKAADAKAVWRGFRQGGGVTIGSLYHLARENGWQGREPVVPAPSPEEVQARNQQRLLAEARRQRQREHQIQYARKVIEYCKYGPHPYLAAKGFPEEQGLIAAGDLIIPMRHYKTNAVRSIQMIKPDGQKLFLKGAPASEAVYKLGRGTERWYCEGYATALSVRAALKALYRDQTAEVVVCFSVGNLAKVAQRGYVIADNDKSGDGEKYAKKTGLPYWMPPEVGTDANDYMLRHGIEALAEELREVLRRTG